MSVTEGNREPAVEAIYPLTPLQHGLLVHALQQPETRAYVEQLACVIDGPLDAARLEAAWRLVVARHAVLRTSFTWKRGDRPLQVVRRVVALALERVPFHDVEAMLAAERARGIDLARPPLMRVALGSRADGERHVMVWTHHHAVLDGWSVPRVLGEVLTAYAGGAASAPAPVRSFQDYVTWLGRRRRDDAEAFWRERLRGIRAPSSLLRALPRAAATSAALPTQRSVRLSSRTTAMLDGLVRRAQVTLATLVDAAWAILLARLSGADDVLFGITVSGRPAELEGAETIVGLCINTIPFRTRIERGEKVSELLGRVHRELSQSKPHEWTPLVDAHGWSEVRRGTPLLEGVVVVENYPAEDLGRLSPPGITVSTVRVVEETGYPWMLVVGPGSELLLRLDADPRVIDDATAGVLLAHLATLLEEMTEVDRTVGCLRLAPRADRQRLEQRAQGALAPGLDRATALSRIRAQAGRSARRTAVRDAITSLTYERLVERAAEVAGGLATAGVRPGHRVGVALPRGVALLEVLLGVWSAGAAFVPVDLRHPAARVSATLEDAGVSLLVAAEGAPATALAPEHHLRTPEQLRGGTRLALEPTPDDLAYVLFTSGSTGRPKGVAVRHGSVANLLASIASEVTLIADDTWLAVTPLTFDIAVLELFGPLTQGATVVLAADAEIGDGAELARRLARERPTVLQATPSTLRMLLAAEVDLPLAGARLLAGGEALNAELARALLATGCALWNVYGPTETTIWSTALRVNEAEARTGGYVAIGSPLANTQALVVDGHGGPLGAGLCGDLWLTGAGLAQGYVGDPERTRAAFVESAWGRAYRTGDRARLREDGVLIFEGREDAQVKLRGHRIELGEIEAQLEAHPAVQHAAAVVVAERVVAHVVGPAQHGELRAWLAGRLPEIMVPARFVARESLPRTANGKIDRAALVADGAALTSAAHASPTRGPLDPVQEMVALALAEVLKLPDVPLDADFFDLGGHSLLATQVLARLRKALGVELPLRDLLQARTARAIADRASALRGVGRSARRPPLLRSTTPWEGREAPASYAQARLWLIEQLEPGRAFHNIPAAVRLRGPLDLERLQAAFDALLVRQAALRTVFVGVEGEPRQVVQPARALSLPLVDLTARPADEREREARRLGHEAVQRSFDLTCDVLLRVLLLRLATDEHVAVISMHHIASDGWSVGVLVGELVALYDGREPPAPAVQMPDFAVWQRAWLEGDGRPLEAQEIYWRARLQDLVPLDLPTDRPRPPVRRFRGERVGFRVEPELAAGVRALARRTSSTLFMTLLAAFDVLLARVSGQPDVAVGTPVAARGEPELEGLVGFFANTLVLRVDVSGDVSFAQLLGRVREAALEAHAHQDLPFEQLVARLNPVRDRSRPPLFEVMFVLQNAPRPMLTAAGLTFEPAEAEVETAKVDLELTMMDAADGGLLASVEIDRDLFDAPTARAWTRALLAVLDGAVRDPEERIARLPLLDAAERAAVLAMSRGPHRGYATDEGLARPLERMAQRAPAAPALTDERGTLSYAELVRAKDRLAHALLARGVARGDRVGIALPRSRELVVAVHACLTLGSPYVPLEPELPASRREEMATDAAVTVVVTDRAELALWGSRALDVAEALADTSLPDAPPRVTVSGRDLAYVLYTSGSTGRPKGVVVEHAGLHNRLEWQQEALALRPDEVVLHKTPAGFDVSAWELLWPFRVGARLVVAPPGAHRDPSALVELIARHGVTTLHFVPSMLAAFLEADGLEGLRSLERVVASGEVLPVDLVRRLVARLPRARAHNLYGPTEASIDVTHFPVPAPLPRGAQVFIGRPIANTRVYVVDGGGEPAPIGARGELWIGGVQVARGYLGDADRTRVAFGEDPFAPGERLYRTGDVGRLRHDGQLEFLGRRDGQVKLRGHRIELDEIAARLRSHPQVHDAAVVLRDERLVGYVVPRVTERDEDLREEHVAAWRAVFGGAYGETDTRVDPVLDLRGWTSSVDGAPIPAPEMLAWVESAVARIQAIARRGPREAVRVLEIGCGTGLLLFRLAPHVGRYVALDIEPGTVARVGAEAAKREMQHVSVRAGAAHDLTSVVEADETFDVVVLNSVVQYFADAAYLLHALEQAVRHLAAGGVLFVGDVRNALLAEALATRIEMARAPDALPVSRVAQGVALRVAEDEELLVDPRFFHELAWSSSFAARVSDVAVRLKEGPYDNELTAYRYDVMIQLDGERPAAVEPERVGWSTLGTVDALRALVASGRACVVTGIPCSRLQRDLAATRLLRDVRAAVSPLRTAGDLRAALAGGDGDREEAGLDPDRLAELGRVSWDLEQPGLLALSTVPHRLPPAHLPLAQLATLPTRAARSRALVAHLREHLRALLPEVMVPAALVTLDALPLTQAGKLDRARLPEATPTREAAHLTAPVSPLEVDLAAAFGEVLGLERVGRDESFFDLGGHSLLATRLVARLAGRLGRRLTLRDVFDAPTVAALAQRAASADEAEVSPIPGTGEPVAPLSFAQERIWFLEQLAPGSPTYNVPAAVRIEGWLDVPALRRALEAVLARQVALRVRIADEGGRPVQRVDGVAPFELEQSDLSGLDEDVRRSGVLAACSEDARAPFDLRRGPLLRARLIRVATDDHVLSLTTHHIASDRWSMDLLVQEIGELYRRQREGGEDAAAPLPPPSISFLDHARWQRSTARAAVLEDLVDRVRRRLDGAPTVVALPTDHPRHASARVGVRGSEGWNETARVPAALGQRVEALARAARTTPFAVFLAALGALLARYGAGDDQVLGTATAGRSRPELEVLAGMFVNTVPLRIRPRAAQTFRALLASTRDEVLEAFACEDAPFERVVEAVSPARSLAHEPVVQVMLVLQNGPRAPLELPGARLSLLEASTGTAKLDLTLFLEPEEGGYALRFEAARSLFERATVGRLAIDYVRLLDRLTGEPDVALDDHPASTEQEVALRVAAGQRMPALPPVHTTIAVRAPDHPLVVRSIELAERLQAAGVGRGDRVVMALDRSDDAVVCLLAILRAGAVYVPLPPSTPPLRAAAILDDARAAVVIAVDPPWPLPAGVRLFALEPQPPDASVAVTAPPSVAPDDVAYLLYTSGSTGVPRGVAVTHAALANHMAWMGHTYPVGANDSVLVRTPLGFDASLWEPLLPLLSGAGLEIVPAGEEADPAALARRIQASGVTVLQVVPTVLAALAQSGLLASLRSLRRIFAGGEPLTPELRDRVHGALAGVELVNLYGPTEATIDATSHTCSPGDGWQVPIGRPIDGVRAYVLDARLRPLPPGAPGLYLAGVCLARGYWGDPARTAERFVPDPFAEGERMYRTGDRARLCGGAAGSLVFLGREDDQVKIGGVRLELGDIEAALAAHPAVRQAAAVVVDTPRRRLLAYLAAPGHPDDLRAWLAARLPPAAMPSQVVILDALPTTASGKVDRRRLPPPPAQAAPAEERLAASAGEVSEVERTLGAALADVLALDTVSAEADFFELGGDSILSLQLVARARASGLEIAPRDVFEARTVRALAARARVAAEVAEAHRALGEGEDLPLSPAQALWTALDPSEPHHFNQSALVEVPHDLDPAALQLAVQALVQRHDALRVRLVVVAGQLRQHVEAASAAAHIAALATRSLAVAPEDIEATAAAVQAEMDLARGPLFRVVHLRLAPAAARVAGRVLLIFHHYIVDTVSWRIVEEDLLSAYAQARAGAARPRLMLPSATLRDHAAWAARTAARARADGEAGYWRQQMMPATSLPRDGDAPPLEATARTTRLEIDVATTRTLTLGRQAARVGELDALLLGPLLVALGAWTGGATFTLAVESHGRASEELDLSRAVGWFTAIYPVRLALPAGAGAEQATAACALALRGVPHGGVGYTLLRPLLDVARPLPEIGFNLLGRRRRAAHAGFAPAREPSGPRRSPRALRPFLLEVVAAIEEDVLTIDLVWSEGVHQRATIEALATRYRGELLALASAGAVPGLSPAPAVEASQSGLDERELARVLKKLGRKT